MKSPLILRGEAATARNLLYLLLAVPEERDLSANRTAVARGSFQLKFDPFIFWRHRVLVNQQRTLLVGHHNVEHAAIPEVRQRDGAAVVNVADSNRLSHIDKFSGAIVQPQPLRLIARQAAALEGRPVFGVANDSAIAAGDLGKVIPVAAIPVERDVTVRQVEIECSVVIEITELRTEAPAAEFDSEIPGQVLVLDAVAGGSWFRHPQIISLDKNAIFRNV